MCFAQGIHASGTRAVRTTLQHRDARREPLVELSGFRGEFHSSLTARSDALFELAAAVSCGDGPVKSLAELPLVGEHPPRARRALRCARPGRVDADRMRQALASVPLPRSADAGWSWPSTSPAGCGPTPTPHRRGSCVTPMTGAKAARPHCRLPYAIVRALEPCRSSWTAPLGALRPASGDHTDTVSAGQLRDLVERLITAGQCQTGDPDIRVIADAGYDAPHMAHPRRDLPVQVLARMRSDRVLRRPAPSRQPHTRGRPPRHGGESAFGQPDTWGTPDSETVTDTRHYGTALARSWDRLHPRLTHRSPWAAAHAALRSTRGP
ncbi:transposase [Streptomyces sp. Qhu_M48]|uniref:transposase n=1 Tax=Streptomyces sp. Qhu_M48 TaxID=3435889 RepID=UPI003F4F8B39